jgi:hypothetical protein
MKFLRILKVSSNYPAKWAFMELISTKSEYQTFPKRNRNHSGVDKMYFLSG